MTLHLIKKKLTRLISSIILFYLRLSMLFFLITSCSRCMFRNPSTIPPNHAIIAMYPATTATGVVGARIMGTPTIGQYVALVGNELGLSFTSSL